MFIYNILSILLLLNLFNEINAECTDCYCQKIITDCCHNDCITTIEPYPCPTSAPTYLPTITPSQLPTIAPSYVPTIAPTTCTCVEDFIESFPTSFQDLIVSSPIEEYTYVKGIIFVDSHIYNDVDLWCIDYEHVLFSGYVYNETVTYPYTEIIATPSLAKNLAQPSRLNQIAWILNNIPVGSLATGPQTWNGVTYSGCGEISVSDIQAVFWALSSPQGDCDDPSSLCTESIATVNVCNAAYIWNTVFNNVPDGASYIVSGPGSYVPIVVVPSNGHQVLITKWATNCDC